MKREGIVEWFNDDEGYGRILLNGEDGNYVFVHFSSILFDKVRFPNEFRYLKQGQKVLFDLVENTGLGDQGKVAQMYK
ncbi:cold shock domain-containing protein [Fictibacillus phosphorivorans]|uniref:cold shock domain-containing protein n=1 Tax=Fictibacillus phosphorivorans TaxID=1221500 RepID=UPI00129300EB|nr:cold shock domain-containing protein [Fictibacillus phosphorivorans]MQR97595.1 cold-shock protein [Fictibacillus phosphorivorans]